MASTRCERCGGLACWRYERGAAYLDLCETCSAKHEPALDAQGWKVSVPA